MQMASEEDPPHFMPNRSASHKPNKKTRGVEGKGSKRKRLPPPTLRVQTWSMSVVTVNKLKYLHLSILCPNYVKRNDGHNKFAQHLTVLQ